MAIITISRGTFSGGKMLAERLARVLEYPCIDRDQLVKSAAAGRMSEFDLRAALEEPPASAGINNHTRYVYLALIQSALLETVRAGRAVYHGFAGHLLLRDAPGVLRLRIIAPLEFRISVARDRLNLGREDAIAYIARMDRDRRRWTQFLYGVDWGDAALYDLVINLERSGVEQASRVVIAAIKDRAFDWNSERRAKMEDVALASRVRAVLATNPYTTNLELKLDCLAGEVAVEGDLSETDFDSIQRIAGALPGVSRVAIKPASRAD